jgi:hypothetical protein
MPGQHWCSLCDKNLRKTQDGFVEVYFHNWEKKSTKTPKTILCKECVERDDTMQEALKTAREKAANPTFKPIVACSSSPQCRDFASHRGMSRCQHIVVSMSGDLYCRRAHPGRKSLKRERGVWKTKYEDLRKLLTELALDLEKQLQKYGDDEQLKWIQMALGDEE